MEENKSIEPTEPNVPFPAPAEQTFSKRKKFFLVGSIIIVLIAGLVSWWLLKDNSSDASKSTTPTTQSSGNAKESKSVESSQLLYTMSGDDERQTLYWQPINGGEKTKATGGFSSKSALTSHAIFNQQVVIATAEYYGETDPPALWYSKDGGKSYKQLIAFTKGENNGLGDQITSLVFSSDGKSVVYGLLRASSNVGEAYELNVATGKSELLFSIQKRGLFIEGYNSTTKQALYYEGCFNCDGNSSTELMKWDGKTNKTQTLLKTDTYTRLAIKSDFTELIALNGTYDPASADFLGGGTKPPYMVQKVSIADGTVTPLASVDAEVAGVGYIAGTGDAYYVTATQIMSATTSPKELFKTSGKIGQVLSVDSERIVVSTSASATDEGYTVQNYSRTNGTSRTIASGDAKMNVFGVTGEK